MLLKRVTKELKKLFQSKRSNNSDQRQEEIVHLKHRLEAFDIQFSSLAYRPSGVETLALLEISKTVGQNDDLLNQLSSKNVTAVQQLLKSSVGICPKMLEEHHKFIITMALIFGGPYPCLREYITSSFI
ncbi:hypothetical protein [Paenibacillus aceris]|uniref:Uncharacterized protein n=1 Tax=Paenibacillus aceris TaxID=869555 RepID=A0ABS4HZW9_9BACL|nr:hypothetical protein [Paenibacillus aceris]MBP1964216.1 hypothetical protein [Paenibacillus aceris]NHW36542.1 hypothetical protein [Paenibacillus aceris]